MQARASSAGSSTPASIYDPAQTFAGFPSEHLSVDQRLEPGPEFSRWEDLTKLPGIVLNPKVFTGRAQYLALRQKFAEGGAWTISEVLGEFPERDRLAVLRTLYWLIKVGLLEMSKAPCNRQLNLTAEENA